VKNGKKSEEPRARKRTSEKKIRHASHVAALKARPVVREGKSLNLREDRDDERAWLDW
jgi:hypothetical protein